MPRLRHYLYFARYAITYDITPLDAYFAAIILSTPLRHAFTLALIESLYAFDDIYLALRHIACTLRQHYYFDAD